MGKLPGKFRTGAEGIVESVRTELKLQNIVRLDPHSLAAHLDIPVISLTGLLALQLNVAGLGQAVEFLQCDDQSELSAATVFSGSERIIIFNEKHPPARQASDICHELAHGLLLHEPAAALDARGCREWNSILEDEAGYLGGALLIPGKAARWVAKCGLSVEAAADRFRCSTQMVEWRLSMSGARRLIRK